MFHCKLDEYLFDSDYVQQKRNQHSAKTHDNMSMDDQSFLLEGFEQSMGVEDEDEINDVLTIEPSIEINEENGDD